MEKLQYPFDGAAILQKKRSLKKELLQKPGLIDKKIAIVGGSTVGEIRNILELFLLDKGIRPTFWEGGYALFYENVVFDDGALAAFAPDILYIHPSNRNQPLWSGAAAPAEEEDQQQNAEAAHIQPDARAALRLCSPV